MPDGDPELVERRLETVLGTLALRLPAGAEPLRDPGASDSDAWFWSPGADIGVLTVLVGPAASVTAAQLLVLERSLHGVTVEVLGAEPDSADGELEFITRRAAERDVIVDDDGRIEHPATGETRRGRFRFLSRKASAVRIGYRLDDSAPTGFRTVFDTAVDSARLL